MNSSKWLYFFLGLGLAYFASVVFIPFFLSLYSAILLEPFVNRLVRKDISRQLASLMVMSAFIICSAVALWLATLSVSSLVVTTSHYPERITHFTTWLHELTSKIDLSTNYQFFTKSPDALVQKVQIVEPYPAWTNYLLRGVGSLYEVLTVALFVPLLLFYFLYDKNNLLESFNSLFGKYYYLPKLNSDLPKMIRAFVAANMITCLLLVFAHGLVLFLLGFSNWIALAIVTGFLSLIPIIGAPLAIALPLIQGVIASPSAFPFVVLAFAFLGFHLLAANILLPYLTGSRINVNSAALIFGLLFWSWLWGAMGFLLAVPMTALVKIFLESNPDTIPIANLLAAKPRHILPGKK